MPEIFLKIIFILVLIPGIPLVFIPMFPALGYMSLVALIFGIVDSFTTLVWWEFLILASFLPISMVVDQSAGILGARYGGASKKAIIWGFVGTLLGLLFPMAFGPLAGLFIGVFAAEIKENFNYIKALKAGAGSVAGVFSGMILNCALAVLFVLLFIVFIF